MLLLSRIVAWDERSLVGEVDVREESAFAEAGMGVPRWVALEYMAQAVGALDGIRLRLRGRPVPPGYLLGTRQLEHIDGHFRPGSTLRIEVNEVLAGENGLGAFHCRLDDGGRAVECRLTVFRPAQDGRPADGI